MRRTRSFRANPSRMAVKIKKFERRLVSLIEDARGELEALVDPSAGRQMEGLDLNSTMLLARMNAILTSRILDPGTALVTDEAVASYKSGVTRADQLLGVGAKASLRMPLDKNALNALKLRSLTNLQGLTDDMGKQIMQTITDGMLRGDGSREIARRISERVDVSQSRARTIARTESMTAFRQGANKRYEQQGVTEVEWSYAGEDGRVCPECRALNGRRFPVGEEPHVHGGTDANCRCICVPLIPKLEDL